MSTELDPKFVAFSGTTKEKVEEFVRDVNTLLDMGMWWSDACEVLFAVKDYGFDKQSDNWGQFLDICVGLYCVSKRETLTDEPLFF